ncbi:MAG: hypothetical protein U1A78_37860 [Polyangia bacterium]
MWALQVKEPVDVKSMRITWIDIKSSAQQPSAPLVPPQLIGYLADPQKPEYPVVMDVSVPSWSNRPVLNKEFRRHKNASWLLFLALGMKGRKYWANISERFYPWTRNIDICVDHYDVFPNCKRFRVDIVSGPCPNVGGSCTNALPLYIYQLASRPAPGDYMNWREPITELDENGGLKESSWIYRHIANPNDPGAFVELKVQPHQNQEIRMRLVSDKETAQRGQFLLLSVCGDHPVSNCVRIVPQRNLKICIDRNAVYTDEDTGYQNCIDSLGGN